MAENVQETKESGPKWEKITAQQFLLEVERCANNARQQKLDPMHAEQFSYEFDEIHIVPPAGIELSFTNAAYTMDPDRRFVIIGNRGHGMKDARQQSLVGGAIVREISVFVSSIEDPSTVIKVKRAPIKRTGW
ncbi:hypothetical protein K2Y00_03720 [Patescibacteria group bacterium]|nr:hypothetical protein [Patescibacteria group bacterium]